ncbi:MAG: transglutaminase-like domain-containing protein [Oscillospiraceae bacterium]|jgi:hypothetical protein|nr:transglutaminase-like domain-containing protein [Oscillospiraceae bacterium]
MHKIKRLFIVLIMTAAIMTGACTPPARQSEETASELPLPQFENNPVSSVGEFPESAESPPEESNAPEEVPEVPRESYISRLVARTAAGIEQPGMTEFDKTKAVFDWLIENASYAFSVGLDIWRIRGEGDAVPSFVEARTQSVILFGIGTCEDYAATQVMLLRAMGMEAEFVTGLTYHREGFFVDHAWSVVKVDGLWYHVDPELEDGIVRNNTVVYKYFMRGDSYMQASHRWGRNLIDYGVLKPDQNEEIAAYYTPPACPQDYPTPPPQTVAQKPKPDIPALREELAAELSAYEAVHGKLEPIALNVEPPVFGRYLGYNREFASDYIDEAERRDYADIIMVKFEGWPRILEK